MPIGVNLQPSWGTITGRVGRPNSEYAAQPSIPSAPGKRYRVSRPARDGPAFSMDVSH
jgi:hypothetical protein